MSLKHEIPRARLNGSGCSQYLPAGATPSTVSEVLLMLERSSESGHAGTKRAARELLEKMAEKEWFITSASKKGGLGSATRPPDMQEHITLLIGRSQYHLRLMSDGTQIREITGDKLEQGFPGYIAPGVPIPTK